jgi:hypothetical protein
LERLLIRLKSLLKFFFKLAELFDVALKDKFQLGDMSEILGSMEENRL